MTIHRVYTPMQIENVTDMFSEIVDSIRATGAITSSTEVNGTYTVYSVNELSKNEFITINGVSYKIKSRTDSSFVITGETGIDFAGESWKSQWPFYHHGHILEIVNTLTQKRNVGGDVSLKTYPMVALIEPFRTINDKGVFESRVFLQMLIATDTSKDYKASQRYDEKFDTSLTPLYESLIQGIKNSKKIHVRNSYVPHEAFNRLYYGTMSPFGTISAIFNHPVDAIEIRDLDLKIFNRC